MEEEFAEEAARRAALEEEEGEERGAHGAMSEDDDSISEVEGSDPEDQTPAQSEAVVTGLANIAKAETKKKYRANTIYYRVSDQDESITW